MNELTITLQPKSSVPMYEQIYNYIKEDIQNGRIRSGEKLPSTRSLCAHLEVSRSTVELAYEQLLSEGYVEARPYRGYFVTEVEELYRLKPAVQERKRTEDVRGKKYEYDFSPNGVDLKSFPYNTWRKLSKECLLDDRAELFRLGNPQGEYGIRNAVVSYLYQARGVSCSPDQIVIGAGNDYLLMLLSAVIGQGHKVAFENPTYKQEYRLLKNLSYEVCTVGMDDKGMRVAELEQSGADIAFVMPSHQYPLGIIMPIRRRLELLRWAEEKEERYIIEDDYDSEFRYKGKPVPALKGYDKHEKVIYIGTFSKSIAPAIRVSYMVFPESLLERYKARVGFINSTVSKVDQLILQKFIEEGYYERHLNKTRALYKSRHDMLLSCMRPLEGMCRIFGENAGVHLLLQFKEGINEDELIRLAEDKDVKVYGLSEYYVEPQPDAPATVLLGYANVGEEKIKKAADLLIQAWVPYLSAV